MVYVFETVLKMSLGATILVLLVLGARGLIGQRKPALLPVLFALLIAKLIFPVSIESSLSVQNVLNVQSAQTAIQDAADEADVSQADTVTDTDILLTNEQEVITSDAGQDTATDSGDAVYQETTPAVQQGWQPSALEIAAIVWIAGMVAFAGCVTVSNIRFVQLLKRNRRYEAPGFNALFTECKSLACIKRDIPVIQTNDIHTAAVYGVFRPKLLIAPTCFDALSLQQKRHILLHELTHIKRKDTLTCFVITVLNIVYWFNPVIWVAFWLMRKDLEVMCDAKVLEKIGDGEKRAYAATLIDLLGISNVRHTQLITTLFINRASIRRRIMMISKYKKSSALYTVFALLLTVMIAVTGCTSAVENTETTPVLTANWIEQPTDIEDADQSGSEMSVLLASYDFDYSEYAEISGLPENIDKAVGLLGGTVIASGEQIDLMEIFSPVTAENGWETAPFIDTGEWAAAEGIVAYEVAEGATAVATADEAAEATPEPEPTQAPEDTAEKATAAATVDEAAEATPEPEPTQAPEDTMTYEVTEGAEAYTYVYGTAVGGGIDLVVNAAAEAAVTAGLDQITNIDAEGEDFTDGYYGLTNHFKDAVTINASNKGNVITIEIYGPASSVQEEKQTEVVDPELIVTYDLDYSMHNSASTFYNVEKAVGLLDGAVIAPGERLSLNSILGPRTESAGWEAAAGISGGTFVMQYGGGVSAVSNALYNAALRAELDIVESSRYSIPCDYVDGGLDATISTSGPDLIIANPYDIDVTIQSRFEDGIITIEIYGPPMDYTVDFSSELVSTGDEPELEYYYNTETAPDGTAIAQGDSYIYAKSRKSYTYDVYKTLYDTDGNVIETSLFYTCTYKAITGSVYVNGPDPEATS